MKHSVKISTYSLVMTVVALAIMIGVLILQADREAWVSVYLFSAVIVLICGMALFYSPISVAVNDDALMVNRSLRVKTIPLSRIESIKLCQPTMAERRISGSGGWFGYWGWFKEKDLGKYFAYYGKSSDCFLVTLKDGSRYMLGCCNPKPIVDYVNSRIS